MLHSSNADGFADEVFLQFEKRHWDGIGNLGEEIVPPRDTETLGSEGDGWYVAGHADNIFGEHKGIGNGDVFPEPRPWERSNPFPNPEAVPDLV